MTEPFRHLPASPGGVPLPEDDPHHYVRELENFLRLVLPRPDFKVAVVPTPDGYVLELELEASEHPHLPIIPRRVGRYPVRVVRKRR